MNTTTEGHLESAFGGEDISWGPLGVCGYAVEGLPPDRCPVCVAEKKPFEARVVR